MNEVLRKLFLVMATLFLILTLLPSVSLAMHDACDIGEEALKMTTLQLQKQILNKYIGEKVRGRGRVSDVGDGGYSAEGNKVYIVIIDCRNDTYIRLLLDKSYEQRIKKLVLGRKIYFEGKLLDLGIFYNEQENDYNTLIIIGGTRIY